MTKQRKTSAAVAKVASKLLKTSRSPAVKKVSASGLSQVAPKRK
jgi:hypothetical protein